MVVYAQNDGTYWTLLPPPWNGTDTDWTLFTGGAPGTGTVTSVGTGTGLTGGPITVAGTISIADDTANSLAGWDNAGSFSSVTVSTGLSLVGGVLTSSAAAGTRTFGWALGLDSDVVVSADQSPWVICNKGGTFNRWDLVAKTGPVGADLVIDILKSTDGGSTFATLWTATPANRPTIADGSNTGTGSTFAVTTFAAGDLLRLDVITIGSSTAGSNVSLAILGTLS